jgi:Peptide N-acetyl-beta-D-glucosaminyl asparaginase amidase A
MRPMAPHARRWLAVSATAIVVLGGTASAMAVSSATAHPLRVAPPGAGASAAAARTGAASSAAKSAVRAGEFTTTANPVTLDPPVKVPPVSPVVVTIADNAAFGNGPPPAVSTVALPQGRWAEVVLDVTGSESGRQYDRLCEVFDGPVQIFLGVTPEPTPAGITWHVQKDITGYLPLLAGTRTFSTYVDNYLSSVDTGIPVITAKLLFYPAGGGFRPARAASLASPALAGDAISENGPAAPAQDPGIPTQVVPVLPAGDTSDFNTVNAGQTLSATVTLPDNVTTATLDLYAVGQSTDEFWWSLTPAFREIEVSVDGKPAGVVWPFPYVYTGGVNSLIWRPVTGIHTMDIPSYRLDLTPFAGLLSATKTSSPGTHTISLTVAGNAGYWLAGGSLLLTAGGPAATGALASDTLSFPTTSQVTTSNALGSSSQPVTSESASAAYQISGTVSQGGHTWTDTLSQNLQFGNDQSYVNPSCSGPCYQWVHQELTSTGSETISSPGARVTRNETASWTIDAPNGYLTNADGSDFFLPASVSQQLTDVATQDTGYRTSLSESIIGYGALEEDNSAPTITNGDTTGTITAEDTGPYAPSGVYQRTVVTRGGVILQDVTSG